MISTTTDNTRWVARSQQELADVLGVSLETVKNWRAAGMPGTTRAYPIPAVINWARTEGPWRPIKRTDDAPSALDEYRRARAAREQLALQRESGELLPQADVSRLITVYGHCLRHVAEQLRDVYGNDALEMYIGGLDEADRRLNEIWGSRDGIEK